MKTLMNNGEYDGFTFLRKQMREEKKLSQGLKLRSSTTQQELQRRHSVKSIAAFFDAHSEAIHKQHYLYVLADSLSLPALYPEKKIYTVDSYNYALYSPEEYTTALCANISKDAFLDIRRLESLKKSKSKSKPRQPIETFTDNEDGIIDVFSEPVEQTSLSLKRVSSTAQLDRIIEYGSACHEEEQESDVAQHQLKRYKKEAKYRDRVEEYKYQVQMEKELRSLQAQLNARKVAALEARVNALHEENVLQAQELTRYKQREAAVPSPRRTVKARPSQSTAIVTRVSQEEAERAEREEQERVQVALAQLDADIETMLVAHTENGTNIGIPVDTSMKLAAYIEKFLEATNAPRANQHLSRLLEHPFLINYRVRVMANMSFYPTNSEYELVNLVLQQKREVLDSASLRVRFNISNTNIHSWFLNKAIEFSNTPSMKHRPVILKGFTHSYAPEILTKWYPLLDAGNGYIITPDLKIVAVNNHQGQGHGKHCCYCDLRYIACRNGVLKHAHQVKNCDYIANASNDERVIIELVIAKAESSPEFRNHDFISKRNVKSLLRVAEPGEPYVFWQRTGERLRINMPVLLGMRAAAYKDFTSRIDSLDIHKPEMNLNAQPFRYQLDCFGHNAPKTPSKNHRKNQTSTKEQIVDGFLYKTLLDHDGLQFRKTKFTADGKQTLRDFTMREDGFGDDLYFSAPVQQLSNQEISDQADAYFLQNSALFAPVQQQEEENGNSFMLEGEWQPSYDLNQLEQYAYTS